MEFNKDIEDMENWVCMPDGFKEPLMPTVSIVFNKFTGVVKRCEVIKQVIPEVISNYG